MAQDKKGNNAVLENSNNSENRKKCFVIMPISDQIGYAQNHFTQVYNQIFKPAIEEAGLECFRVDETNLSESILGNIIKAITECEYALCDLSSKNPNVLYELGIRQAFDKPVVLVQDDKTERIFDVSGINTITYCHERIYENVMDARKKITDFLKSTISGNDDGSLMKILGSQAALEKNTSEIKNPQNQTDFLLKNILSEMRVLKDEVRSATSESHYLSNDKSSISNIDRDNNLYSSQADFDWITNKHNEEANFIGRKAKRLIRRNRDLIENATCKEENIKSDMIKQQERECNELIDYIENDFLTPIQYKEEMLADLRKLKIKIQMLKERTRI